MKIQVTYTSFLTAIMLTSVLFSMILLYMRFKKPLFSRTEVRLLLAAFGLVIARLLCPIEILPVTHSVFVTALYYRLCAWLRTPLIGDLPLYLCLAHLSLAGTIVIAACRIRSYAVLLRAIRCGTVIGSVNAGRDIPIIESRLVNEPFLIGLLRPRIVLPARLCGDRDDIIRHELNHYRHHDLLCKYFLELLCIIFWWNPVMYLLRRQMGNVLEIRNDFHSTAALSEEGRLQYADTLLAAAKGKRRSAFGIGLAGTQSFLTVRIHSIVEEPPQRKGSVIPLLPVIGITVLSFGIILEPSSPINIPGLYDCHPGESFIIENHNVYDVYLDGKFFYDYDNILTDFSEFPVYKKGEYHDKEIIFNLIRRFHFSRNAPCQYICGSISSISHSQRYTGNPFE